MAKGTQIPVVRTSNASLHASVIASLENIAAKSRLRGIPLASKLLT
jgi:hypothetical protein